MRRAGWFMAIALALLVGWNGRELYNTFKAGFVRGQADAAAAPEKPPWERDWGAPPPAAAPAQPGSESTAAPSNPSKPDLSGYGKPVDDMGGFSRTPPPTPYPPEGVKTVRATCTRPDVPAASMRRKPDEELRESCRTHAIRSGIAANTSPDLKRRASPPAPS